MTARDCLAGGGVVLRLTAGLVPLFAFFAVAACGERFAAAQVPIDTLTTVERTAKYTEWIGIDADGKYRFRPFQ